MLYIFDLGNVIVDIDFSRVLGVWSDLSRVPLATLNQRFVMGETFEQHERGEIDDETFAALTCKQLGLPLSFEQFSVGWQSIFVELRCDVITIMQRLRSEGHKVVVLSNTNRLHTQYWPDRFPDILASADKIYLSQEMGMRKPEPEIYQAVLTDQGVSAQQALFFDDNEDNVVGARACGIESIQVVDKTIVPDYFAK